MANPWDAPRSPNYFPKQTTEFDENTRRRLDGLGPVKPQLSADEIKVAYEEALREDQAHQDRLATQAHADAFISGHPELVDNSANAQLLLNQARTMFGDGVISIEMWEQAYQHLRHKTDFLKLDKKELEKQQAAASRQRYAEARAAEAARTQRTFSPNANYDELSLEEIRNRADEQARHDMQLAGERGGNNF